MASSRTPGTSRSIRTSPGRPRRTSGSPPVSRTFETPSSQQASVMRASSSNEHTSSWESIGTPSAGMQYAQRQLQRSVTESRR